MLRCSGGNNHPGLLWWLNAEMFRWKQSPWASLVAECWDVQVETVTLGFSGGWMVICSGGNSHPGLLWWLNAEMFRWKQSPWASLVAAWWYVQVETVTLWFSGGWMVICSGGNSHPGILWWLNGEMFRWKQSPWASLLAEGWDVQVETVTLCFSVGWMVRNTGGNSHPGLLWCWVVICSGGNSHPGLLCWLNGEKYRWKQSPWASLVLSGDMFRWKQSPWASLLAEGWDVQVETVTLGFSVGWMVRRLGENSHPGLLCWLSGGACSDGNSPWAHPSCWMSGECSGGNSHWASLLAEWWDVNVGTHPGSSVMLDELWCIHVETHPGLLGLHVKLAECWAVNVETQPGGLPGWFIVELLTW